MFKKIIFAVLLALPFAGFAQKFATVNLEEIFKAMPESATMQSQIADASKRYEEEFQKLREEVDKLYADYQTLQNDPNTPESIKERRVQDIRERAAKLDQFQNTAQQDLARLSEQLSAPIQQKMTDAIKAVGQEGGYTFIFPSEPSLILYQGADVVNITADVKTKLGI